MPQQSFETTRAAEALTPATIKLYAEAVVPTEYGQVRTVIFRDDRAPTEAHMLNEHAALVVGDVRDRDEVLVRIHSECWTGEVLHSLKCDCREQLDAAMTTIGVEGCGVVLYLRQEGRGIGLGNKIQAYALQAQGLDTLQANRALGFGDDLRDFSIAGEMLAQLGVRSVSLLTNNPQKVSSLAASGIKVVNRRPMLATSNPHNARYLATKNDSMGHDIRLWFQDHVGPDSQPMFSQEQIASRIAEMAHEIACDYAGKEVVAVGVLNGGFSFFADLIRQIQIAREKLGTPPIALECGFIGLQSYEDNVPSLGILKTVAHLNIPVTGKHVLLVDDIISTGLTTKYLLKNLALRNPLSIKACVLLRRKSAAAEAVRVDYVGFAPHDQSLLFGADLDYKQKLEHRHEGGNTMRMSVQIYCRKPTIAEMEELFSLNTTHVAWGIDPSAAGDIELSRQIVERARRRGVGTTILSTEPSVAAIERAMGDIAPDFVLLAAEHVGHGIDESDLPGLARALAPRTTLMMSVPIRRAGSRLTLDSIAMAERYQEFAGSLILDTQLDPEDGAHCGCTGRTNDWEICGEIVRRARRPVMLAGGLGPHNVADAIRAIRPWGVDACSSLERPDQTKDLAASDAFIRAAKAAVAP